MDIQEADEITPETVRWYQWSLSLNLTDTVTCMTFGRDSDNLPVLYVGTSLGKIGVFNRDAYLDFGEEYETAFTTKHEDFGAPGVNKTVGDMHLVSRGNGDYSPTHQYIFDDGHRQASTLQNLQFETIGGLLGTTFILGSSYLAGVQNLIRQKFYGYGSGETIAHRFRHNPSAGNNEPFFLASIAQQVVRLVNPIPTLRRPHKCPA